MIRNDKQSMRTMINKVRWLVLAVMLPMVAPSYAETFFVDCNLKGIGNTPLSQERGGRILWNRHVNTGKGNGGESMDFLFHHNGDLTVTCVSTADEETTGSLWWEDAAGNINYLGPNNLGGVDEIDPGFDPNTGD